MDEMKKRRRKAAPSDRYYLEAFCSEVSELVILRAIEE